MTTPPDRRRRLLALARQAWVGLLVVVLVAVVVRERRGIALLVADANPLLLVACLLAGLGQIALTTATWGSGLRSLGHPVPYAPGLAAAASTAPARYLPGSVWHSVSRAAVLRGRGVPVSALATVATVEMALVPVVGFAFGSALLAVAGGEVGSRLTTPLLVAAAVLLVLTTPPVVNAILRWRGGPDAARLTWPALGRLIGWVAAYWAWSSLVFTLYVSAFPAATDAPLLAVAGAYMLAWGVGWLAVFAPQGIGVFEVTLAALLAGGATELAVVLAGYRVLSVGRDLLAAGLALLAARRSPVPA